jgi:glycosyltransferase involved in cell wall biosynthesis
MRLLYVHYGPQSGVTASLARALAGARVEVVPYSPLDGMTYQRRLAGLLVPNARPSVVRAVGEAVRRHGRHWKSYYFHTPYFFDLLSSRVGRAIRRERPDVVLQNGVLFGPGPYAQVPYWLYLDHTRAIAERYPPLDGLAPPVPADPPWNARERAVYRNAAGIFTMSEFVRASLQEDYDVDPERVRVVGAGPNVEPESDAELRLHRTRAFLFVGRNWTPKGGPELLEAFARVRASAPDAQLWVVSQHAPDRAPPGVTFHGVLGLDALARLYATASVFVLPTLREAFGLSLLEAMSFGLPCVASRLEAIPEIVSDGESGVLVPPRDVAALARAMADLLADPVRAKLMGTAGRARALSRFGWDRAAHLIVEALAPGRGGAAAQIA